MFRSNILHYWTECYIIAQYPDVALWFISSPQGTPEAVEEVGAMLVEKLPVVIQSGDLEVQERACCILQVCKALVPAIVSVHLWLQLKC